MSLDLTLGAIESIYNQPEEDDEPQHPDPTLQVLSCKKVDNNSGGQDRFRIIVSDGAHFMQGMLSTSLNELAASGQLDKFTVVRVDQYACNTVSNRKIMILLNLCILGNAQEKIGTPAAVGAAPPAAAAPQAPAAAAPAPAPAARNGGIAKAPAKPAAPAARAGIGASSNRGASSRSGNASAPVYPIEGLSPYQNKWTIKARVSTKSEIKHWSNQRGEGKLFNVTFMDESGEIRATGFNQQVDQFFDMLQDNKVYMVSKARVNIAKKQFNNVNNEYELMLGNDTEISLCEDASDVPAVRYNFVELANISSVEKDQMCDVIGVVKDVGDLGSIVSKATQRTIPKRELGLVDGSGFSIRMTLWGKQAEQFSAPEASILAFRGVKVGDFGGRSLSMVSSSTMMTEPDIPEAHNLRGWFDTHGTEANFQSHSTGGGGRGATWKAQDFRTVQQVRDEGLGHGDQTNYFNLRSTILFIKGDNLSYPACPTEGCNKKVVMEGDNAWRCEKCERTYEAPEYRYVLSLSVGDYTGQCWLSGFNDVGKLLVGSTADEMEQLRESDEATFKNKLALANSRMWEFACRAKSDSYNDQVKVKYQILQARPIDFVAASKDLVDRIGKFGLLD